MRCFNYSVVIPYRDKYDMLLKAVESVPDRVDIQIIIVDNSEKPLLQEDVPKKNHSEVVFTTSSPTKGAGCARNEGLKHVAGKFIVFLDADDYFTPTAFDSFDRYLEADFDIVYFDADSVRLIDGEKSNRHKNIHHYIMSYIKGGDENQLRYRFVNPIAKMIRTSLVKEYNLLFEEVKVSNDAMFSVKTGHYAKEVTASEDIVYMITEGEEGSSLTRARTADNMFIRYQVAVRRYRFITEVGPKDMRPRLGGFLKNALFNFGPKELFRYLKYARENRIGIF